MRPERVPPALSEPEPPAPFIPFALARALGSGGGQGSATASWCEHLTADTGAIGGDPRSSSRATAHCALHFPHVLLTCWHLGRLGGYW